VAEIGVAQKAVRLRWLDRMAQRAETNHRPALAAAFLEQAAKECGGAYESHRSVNAPTPSVPENPSAAALVAR
jgi:hypothetical protein